LTLKESRYWDAVAAAWDKARPQTLWRAHSDTVNCSLLARWLPESRVEWLLKTDAFDEAVGDGLQPFLSLKAKRIVSMDVSMSALSLARARHTGLYAVGADVRRLPFADGTFDVIVSTSTLDHFRSRDELVTGLRECSRVLRSGGQLLLTLDNLANPLVALRNALPFRLLQRLRIVSYYVGATYGPRRIRRILPQVGFEVLEIGAVLHCPRFLAVACAGVLERYTTREIHKRFLCLLLAFERLSQWPTRFLTGCFVVVRAEKR
jgi:SAM-dependent methyltransferase